MKLTPSPFAPARFPDLPVVKGVRAATGSRGFYAARGLTRDDVFLFAFDEGTHCAGVYTISRTASDWHSLRARATPPHHSSRSATATRCSVWFGVTAEAGSEAATRRLVAAVASSFGSTASLRLICSNSFLATFAAGTAFEIGNSRSRSCSRIGGF